ncbi:prepilin peptidase [Janthinobacterium fluminis]|uniref:A24 family peptidase n=1 Tax=Janthinobacterium fluminis TaxID=2987524 RepID=A0ABT5K2P8_9BURK|nr:A24 family peptidase [Janthinobacterium fluminis]MDC8759245.1 A24 family peptidase [Janthinobacterium fluminis]
MNANLAPLSAALLLGALLAAAVWHDVRSRRIPNRLVLLGALAGLALHALAPAGAGLFRAPFGGLGALAGLAGLGAGLAVLLPMYLLRAMGAGDVKLMAMVGAFLGPRALLDAALWSLLAGGALALLAALCSGRLLALLANAYQMMLHALVRTLAGAGGGIDAPAAASGKLPYAIAIACGTLLHLLLSYLRVPSLLP